MKEVEVVVCHWRRPHNIPLILHALRNQSISVTCTLIDAHTEHECAVDQSIWDRVFVVPNMGAWNRFALAGAYDHKYTLLLDDDVLPSYRMVEWLKTAAESVPGFSVIGFLGRNLHDDNVEFIDNPPEPVVVGWLARVYFIKTRDIGFAITSRMLAGIPIKLPTNHSDVVSCYGIWNAIGEPCYAVPEPAGMSWGLLSQNDAVCTTEGYEASLVECIKMMRQ